MLSLKCLMKAFVSFSLITGIVRTGFANIVICSTSFLLSFASLCCLHIFYHPRESICNFFFSIPFDFCGFPCFSLRYFHDLMPPFLFFCIRSIPDVQCHNQYVVPDATRKAQIVRLSNEGLPDSLFQDKRGRSRGPPRKEHSRRPTASDP